MSAPEIKEGLTRRGFIAGTALSAGAAALVGVGKG